MFSTVMFGIGVSILLMSEFVQSSVLPTKATRQKLILTNDDGWAVAQIRAQRDALVDAGVDVRVFCCGDLIHLIHSL